MGDENTQPLLLGGGDGPENHFSSAGIWSQLTFRWLNPLFEKGYSQKLQIQDIPPIPPSERAEESSLVLEQQLLQSPSLPKAIFYAIWRPLLINGFFAVASYVGPLLITSFINFLSSNDDENTKRHHGVILAMLFFAANTIDSLSQRQWYFGAHRIGIRVRASLMAIMFKKSLSTNYGGTISSSGQTINIVNVDVERIGDFLWHLHNIWLLPVKIIFALAILYRNLGLAPSMAALFTTIAVMLSNIPLTKMQVNLNTKIMEAKDARIKATSETLKTMRVLKLHSWEPVFLKKLLHLRDIESVQIKKYLYTSSAVVFLFWASPTLVSVATFSTCVILGMPLTPSTVLSALATFRILQEPIHNLTELISVVVQTKVSIGRVQDFITGEDRERLVHSSAPAVAIEVEPCEFAWHESNATLKIVEGLTIPRGSKVAVCGSMGSGKTSFLCSVLGEIPRISRPRVRTYGSKSFVPQSAWLQTGTVKDNVLFGKEMNRDLYETVVEACALNHDFERWDSGDLCVVEERGLNLSGGQKQRIQMARALYSNSDVYLLDDPFSAVDALTGAHMFEKCLKKFLREKTVVYVTHQLEFLADSDLVLVMKDGKIVEVGKYRDLISNSFGKLRKLVEAHGKSLDQVNLSKHFVASRQTELSEIKSVDLTMSLHN